MNPTLHAVLFVLSAVLLVVAGISSVPQISDAYGRAERAGWFAWLVLLVVVAAADLLALL